MSAARLRFAAFTFVEQPNIRQPRESRETSFLGLFDNYTLLLIIHISQLLPLFNAHLCSCIKYVTWITFYTLSA